METRLEEDEENEDYEEEEEDNEEAEENQMSTVVCGLYSHVQEPSLLPVIEYAADQMTKIAFEGSRLLNLTVLYLSQTNQPFPATSPRNLLQVCRDAFRAVCAKKNSLHTPLNVKTTIINAVRDGFYPISAQRKWHDMSYLSEVLTAHADSYRINMMNMVIMNLCSRVCHWINHKLHWIPFQQKAHLKAAELHLWNLAYNSAAYRDPTFLQGYQDLDRHIIRIRMIYILDKLNVSILGGRSLVTRNVKQGWWNYYPVLYNILKHINKNPHTRGLKTFTMVPLHSFKCKHIRIGRDALRSFWSATGWDGRRRGEIVSREDFNEEADLFWKLSFNVEKFETNNRKFANTLTTNGWNLSLCSSQCRSRFFP